MSTPPCSAPPLSVAFSHTPTSSLSLSSFSSSSSISSLSSPKPLFCVRRPLIRTRLFACASSALPSDEPSSSPKKDKKPKNQKVSITDVDVTDAFETEDDLPASTSPISDNVKSSKPSEHTQNDSDMSSSNKTTEQQLEIENPSVKAETEPETELKPEPEPEPEPELKPELKAPQSELKSTPTAQDSENDDDKETSTSSSSASSKNSVRLELTPEQTEKARSARTAAEKAAEEKSAATKAQNIKLRENISKILSQLGEKTRTFELGRAARAKAEEFIEKTIGDGENEKAEQSVKVKGQAAKTAKTTVNSISKLWDEKAIPVIRSQLPEDFKDLQSKTLASFAIGIVFAFVLAPTFLFSGGGDGQKQMTQQQKKIEKDTVALERKLSSKKIVSDSSTNSSTSSNGSVFPSEESTAPKPSITQKKRSTRSTSSSSTTTASSSTTTASSDISTTTTTPIPTPTQTQTPTPPSDTTKVSPTTKEPVKLKEVTPALALSTVTKSLGNSGSLVLSASFDSLYEEPTVALIVSKGYHKLKMNEQRAIAESALQAVRSLGYERVTLTEEGSGRQVAQAGIDIDLEDETENLRSEVMAMKSTASKLAVKSTEDETTINGLQSRLEEERELLAKQQQEYERNITALRKENTDLAEDLSDAKSELARMPDRLDLERRTLEAEELASKMSNSVEMLSIQLAKARGDESVALDSATRAAKQVENATKEKESAILEAQNRERIAIEKAKRDADDIIATSQKEAAKTVSAAEERVKMAEEQMQRGIKTAESKVIEVQKAADKKLIDVETAKENEVASVVKKYDAIVEDVKKQTVQDINKEKQTQVTIAKQLEEVKAAREKEILETSKKYEAMLEDAKKKANADLDIEKKNSESRIAQLVKEAKSEQSAIEKERDAILKEKKSVEENARKTADKLTREKAALEKQIAKLQAKAKGDGGSEEAVVEKS